MSPKQYADEIYDQAAELVDAIERGDPEDAGMFIDAILENCEKLSQVIE